MKNIAGDNATRDMAVVEYDTWTSNASGDLSQQLLMEKFTYM